VHSPNIFIGYRRGDGAGWAGRLHADLRARLGRDSEIFMDVDGIPPGEDFRVYIDRAIGQCDAFVAMIGPNWLDARDAQGRRRLDDPGDFVRLEIAAALDRNIRVIPVLVGGARLPTAEELPEPLDRLVNRHAISLDNETWELGVSRIVGSFGEPTDPLLPRLTRSTRRLDSGRRAGPRPRPYRIIGIVLILVVVLILVAGFGATVLGRSLNQSSAPVATPAPTSPPSVTSTSPPATTSAPETTAPPPPETTASPARPAPAPPGRVVEAYYEAINARDYRAAWALVGGNKFGQTYDEFAAGFANTVHDDLTITGVNGDTVTVTLVATRSDGSTRTYRGTYTVRGGRIIEGHLRQVG
jgi:cell division septation protein DedD